MICFIDRKRKKETEQMRVIRLRKKLLLTVGDFSPPLSHELKSRPSEHPSPETENTSLLAESVQL